SFGGRAAAIGLFFLSRLVMAHALPKSSWAGWYLVDSSCMFLAMLASLGTPQILSRTVRQTIYGPHPENTAGVIQSCAKMLIIGCLLMCLGYWVVMPYVIDVDAQWQPFRDFPLGILAWACLSSACFNSAFALQGLDDFRGATLVGSRRGGV